MTAELSAAACTHKMKLLGTVSPSKAPGKTHYQKARREPSFCVIPVHFKRLQSSLKHISIYRAVMERTNEEQGTVMRSVVT